MRTSRQVRAAAYIAIARYSLDSLERMEVRHATAARTVRLVQLSEHQNHVHMMLFFDEPLNSV